MNDVFERRGLPGGAQDCVFAGLEAHLQGQDALLAGLQKAHAQIEAQHSIWSGGERGGYALCDERGARRVQELPGHLPGRWLRSAPGGPVRLVGPDRLNRDPRARALGVDWGLVASSQESGGRVWFGATRPLEVSAPWSHSLIRALASLEQLDGERRREGTRTRLANMGERAAAVAHDLRNQLSLTKLEFARALLSEQLDLEQASAALDGALDMCRTFLTEGPAAQHEAQALEPHLRTQIQQAVRLSGRHGEVRVALRCPAPLTAVFSPELLGRYLRNLLLNAIAACARGAVVRVEARATDGGRVLLTVADEGSGMERVELERLLHAGESRGGTGFGTSSVLDCAKRMAADLDVESKPAAGTTFSLSLAGS